MNPRIEKITEDIAKLKRRIINSQTRLRDLERLKVELENADIIAAVRRIDVPAEEISTLIQKLQSQTIPHFEVEQHEEAEFFEED